MWLKQSEFSIVEEEGHRLIGRLSGQIDPYMVHSCDFSTSWAAGANGGAAGTVTTSTPHDGKQCIKHAKTGPLATTAYTATYTAASSVDLTDFTKIRFWLKSAKPSSYYGSVRLYVMTDAVNHGYWNISITAAVSYTHLTLPTN